MCASLCACVHVIVEDRLFGYTLRRVSASALSMKPAKWSQPLSVVPAATLSHSSRFTRSEGTSSVCVAPWSLSLALSACSSCSSARTRSPPRDDSPGEPPPTPKFANVSLASDLRGDSHQSGAVLHAVLCKGEGSTGGGDTRACGLWLCVWLDALGGLKADPLHSS